MLTLAAGFLVFSLLDPQAPVYIQIFFGVLALSSFALAAYGLIAYGKRSVVIQKFCKDNNLEFVKNVGLPADTPNLMNLSGIRRARNGVRNVTEKEQYMVFDYRYQTGSGRHPSTTLYSVAMANLKQATPNIIALHKKSPHKLILWGRLGKNFLTNTPLDDTFKFYGSEQGKKDLLKLLAQPEVTNLINEAKSCDFELYNQRLYIFMKGNYKNASSAKALFDAARSLAS